MSLLRILPGAFVFLLILSGCDIPEPRPMTRGDIFVDNTSQDAMIVSINGRKRGIVPPGECSSIETRLGERTVTVSTGDEVIYEGKHHLSVGHDPRTRPAFFLNLNDRARYCRVNVVYGNDAAAKGFASGMSSMITQVASHKAVGDNPQERAEWVAKRQRENKFRTIMNGMSTFGSERLSRFYKVRYMLEPMPSLIIGNRHSSSEKRTAIIRIPIDICDEIETLDKIEDPTDEDIKKATILKEMIDELVPIE